MCSTSGIRGCKGACGRGAAGRGQGPQGQAVIGFPAGDEPYLLRAAHGQMNLAGQFDGRLHGLAPAGEEIKALYALRGVPAQANRPTPPPPGSRTWWGGRSSTFASGRMHGLGDLTAAVPHIDHHRPAAGVQIFLPFSSMIQTPSALAAWGRGPFSLRQNTWPVFTHGKTLYSGKRFKCTRSGIRKKVDFASPCPPWGKGDHYFVRAFHPFQGPHLGKLHQGIHHDRPP